MYKHAKAFSLIELLIVITIVGILAAIAVPAFQSYLMRVKIADAYSFVDSYSPTILAYYEKNGTFPDGAALGIDPAQTAYQYSPYILFMGTNVVAPANGVCPMGGMFAYLTNYQGDANASGDAPLILVYDYMADINGTIIKKCFQVEYTFNNDTVDMARGYVAGCSPMIELEAFLDSLQTACQ